MADPLPLNLATWLLALSPVIGVLILMVVFRWGASQAGAAAWFAAVIVGVVVFRATIPVLGYAQTKAVLLSLDVLYIIWMALLFFLVADEAGAVAIIGRRLPALTSDKVMQALLLSWVFVSFLQGMGGFGVPVAVVAPLLVGIGFSALESVVMASLGHGWAVTFGSLGTSFAALLATTGQTADALAPESALLLGLAAFACGALVAYMAAKLRGVVRALPALLVIGTVMADTQYLLATNGLWNLGATGASLGGLCVAGGVARLPFYQREPASLPAGQSDEGPSLPIALSAYVVLVVLIAMINLVPPVERLFDTVVLSLAFPAVETARGWVTPAGSGRAISLFGHPGAILLYASLVAYIIYRQAGCYQEGAVKRITTKVLNGAVKSSLGIVAMVGMATIMGHAGMTTLIARGLSETVVAGIYPAAAPFVGALGAFMTGSNTNSNVVFGALQMQTAELLGLSISLILAAQTTGGALGSVLAPAKVIVGCSTVGLAGEEGPVIGRMLVLGLIPVALTAIVVWILE
ncbi:MAG: L-lactate permease [Anaerolineae bacterium]